MPSRMALQGTLGPLLRFATSRHLHSHIGLRQRLRASHSLVEVVSANDEHGAYASATCTLDGADEPAMKAAAQAALQAVSNALGPQRPPSCLLAFTSAPHPLAQAAVSSIADAVSGITNSGPGAADQPGQALQPPPAVAGCSTLRWLPEADRRTTFAAASAAASAAAAPSSSSSGATGGASSASSPQLLRQPYHITLAAAHLPHAQVHAFRSPGDSVPRLPDLARALAGERPPQFVVLAAQEGGLGLTERLENLFGSGSCIAGAVAALQLPARRVAVALDGAPNVGIFTLPLAPAQAAGESSQIEETDSDDDDEGSDGSEGSDGEEVVGKGPDADRPQVMFSLGGVETTGPALQQQRRAGGSLGGSSSSSQEGAAGTSGTSGRSTSLVYEGASVHASGCSGLVVYPQQAQGRGSSSSSGGGGAGQQQLPPTAASLLCRIVFGGDRFHTLELPDRVLSTLQPPPTGAVTEWVQPHAPPPADPDSWRPAVINSPHINVLLGPQAPAAPLAAAAGEAGAPAGTASGALRTGRVLPRLPLFCLGPQFLLFSGEQATLRIFEKRYQLLLQAAMDQGACFGLPSDGMGITAVVRKYYLDGPEFYVVVEGGDRFTYPPDSVVVAPASYGLNTADVEVVQDAAPAPGESEALVAAAREVVDRLHEGAARSLGADAAAAARTTLSSALFMASTGSSSASGATAAAGESSGSSTSGGGGASAALEALAAAKADAVSALDAQSAAALSMYLGALMPVEVEVRRRWFNGFNSLERLSEQARKLTSFPNVATATAAEALRTDLHHPLRRLAGLGTVEGA